MIELKSVFKSYKLKKETVPVLKDIQLTITKPGLVYLMGESGSGKSTLLNIIGGLDQIDQGSYCLFGADTATLSEKNGLRSAKVRWGLYFSSIT